MYSPVSFHLELLIVVEPSPHQGLAADCPIFNIFKPSHLGLFHPYVVVIKALRVFQQLERFIVNYSLVNPLQWEHTIV